MKITFNINYRTRWGESLYICGGIPALGNSDPHKAAIMMMAAPDMWALSIELPASQKDFDYYFIVKSADAPWRFEWGKPHHFTSAKGLADVDIFDIWQEMPADKPFYSSLFTDGVLRRNCPDQVLPARPASLCMRVKAPMVAPDEVLAIAGECKMLGDWNPAQAPRFNDAHYPLWEINLPIDQIPRGGFDYKFVILDKNTLELRRWEQCDNRHFGIMPATPRTRIVVDGLEFAIGDFHWKGAGTAIPVFSIRSEEDFGCGDFMDIRKMADWCALTGQKVLQLLPINDTTLEGTWLDSYPYRANSTFALHPLYLRLEQAGKLKDAKERARFKNMQAELNALPEVDYERVTAAKNEYMRMLFAEKRAVTVKRADYLKFVADNDYWLRPYAVWCVLRDKYNTPDNSKWEAMAEYDRDKVNDYYSRNIDEIEFYYFVQYHLDKQLRDARDYARQKGVVLKGDIPIGIGRYSVDAWQYPQLFNMNCQAGAPPDDFSVLGQNWGFPTYNWDEMARDGFEWWKNRFRKMAEYFDAYRIDHILGFFRIWQIPLDATHGLLGYFNPALPLSPDEMRNRFGFYFDYDRMTRPMMYEWMLHDFFGDTVQEALDKYLVRSDDGRYFPRQEVDTQRKIEDLFDKMEDTPANNQLRDALLGLLDNVLFIADPYQEGHYHPRISAQFSYQYRVLNDHDKACFNALYNDFFYRRNDEFWRGKAMWKLPPLIDSTGMLTCAEDLGMIPDCVPDVMSRLEILSLEIQRMPKDPKALFGDTWHYPYYSVCTTSTHDMPGLRAWWESDPAKSQVYYNQVLHLQGEAPFYAEPWLCSQILQLHLQSPSMLCILPLQDWLSADGNLRRKNPQEEQINEPSNPRHYWRYRMHISVEKLMTNDGFNDAISDWIHDSGR